MRNVSMQDIAAKLGVSAMTVSNALNGKACVAPETAKRVLEAASEMNFRKNVYASVNSIKKAKSARLRRVVFNASRLVDASSDDIHLYRDIYFALMEKLNADGCELILDNKDASKASVELALADAIIEIDNVSSESLAVSNAPRICVFFERAGSWSIFPDNEAAGRKAAEILVRDCGFERIVASCAGTYDQNTRFAALRRYGCEFLKSSCIESFPANSEHALREAILGARKPRPQAVFFLGGSDLLGAIRHFQDWGVKVPDDISILGFDDFPFYKWTPLRVSRLYFEPMEIASAVCDALRGIVSGSVPAKIITPIYFKEGDSLAKTAKKAESKRN